MPILEALVAAPEVDVVAVVSAPDRPSGRGGAPSPTPVAARTRELRLRLLQPVRIRDEAAVTELAALRPDLGVLADYGQIIPAAILELSRNGILNVHPSLLPRHRGASPIPATILAGDPTTGVTVIRMDAGLDTGPIVAEEAWPLRGTETSPELEVRAAQAGARLVSRALAPWLAGSVAARPQDESAATQTRLLRKEDGLLDPRRPALELARQVRALQPWPGSYLDTDAGRLTVWRATPSALAFKDEPGRFVLHDRLPALTTSDRRLVLEEVQPANGRRMTGEEFLRGRGRRLMVPAAD